MLMPTPSGFTLMLRHQRLYSGKVRLCEDSMAVLCYSSETSSTRRARATDAVYTRQRVAV